MTPEDFKRELRTCNDEDKARALFKEAKDILQDKEYTTLVDEVANGYVGGYSFRAFVRRVAWKIQEKK